MKTEFLCFCLAVIGVAMQGCGDSSPPPTTDKVRRSSPSMPSLSAEPQASAQSSPGAGSVKAGTMAPPPPIDFATVARTSVGHGEPTSDLEILNEVLERYRNAAPLPSAADSSEGPPPITDLTQLVKAGIIKALPAPPAGKQFALDSKTGQAVLVNKK